jgi:hypothetical protein
MLSDLYPDLGFPEEGPEFEVWNHLESGLQLAADELDYLGDLEFGLVEAVSKLTSEMVLEFVSEKEKEELYSNLQGLMLDPWVKHGIEVNLARKTLSRASGALDRYRDLAPVFSSYELTKEQRRYLAEAIECYLLHFDAACIAFCGATIEQFLLHFCQDRGLIQPLCPEDRTPPFGQLLDRSEGSLSESARKAAKRAGEHRNRVMHRQIWDPRILGNIALQSVGDLAEIVKALA